MLLFFQPNQLITFKLKVYFMYQEYSLFRHLYYYTKIYMFL